MAVVLLWITGRYDNGEIYADLGGPPPPAGTVTAVSAVPPKGKAETPVPVPSRA